MFPRVPLDDANSTHSRRTGQPGTAAPLSTLRCNPATAQKSPHVNRQTPNQTVQSSRCKHSHPPRKNTSRTWQQRQLGELANITSGKSVISNQSHGAYAVLGSRGIIGHDDSYDYQGSFILIARVGAHAGHMYHYVGKVKISDNTIFLTSQMISFLYCRLLAFNLKQLSFGTGQPLIKANELKSLLLTVPPTSSEQERIVGFFCVLDDLIAAAKKKADLLKLKKRYYLQAIFSQQLRFKGFTGPWQQRKYSDYLIESNIPGHDGSEANKLTVKLWGKGVVEKETVTAGSNATKYYIRHTGQLMYGKLDFLHAAFGLVPPELDGYESTADSPAFDILPSADPNFILMTCLSEHTYLYQGNLADGSRKAKRVHVPTFLDMSLNVPNIEEQRRIVSFLHIIDKLIAAANHKAELLIQQKNAYLQRLFV